MNELYCLYKRILEADYVQLKENAASYYLTKECGKLIILFEKSNGATDWKNNLDFPARPYREMKDLWFVHRGFLRVFKTVKDKISDEIADKSVKRIIVGGYSHGAALALLTHEYCVFNRPDIAKNVQGYGFGCPRTVWGILPESVKARFDNFCVIRNSDDVVTHLPPAVFGFRHVGKMLHIGKNKRYGAVESHKQENYLAELRALK